MFILCLVILWLLFISYVTKQERYIGYINWWNMISTLRPFDARLWDLSHPTLFGGKKKKKKENQPLEPKKQERKNQHPLCPWHLSELSDYVWQHNWCSNACETKGPFTHAAFYPKNGNLSYRFGSEPWFPGCETDNFWKRVPKRTLCKTPGTPHTRIPV